jgi:hypothetical protein
MRGIVASASGIGAERVDNDPLAPPHANNRVSAARSVRDDIGEHNVRLRSECRHPALDFGAEGVTISNEGSSHWTPLL